MNKDLNDLTEEEIEKYRNIYPQEVYDAADRALEEEARKTREYYKGKTKKSPESMSITSFRYSQADLDFIQKLSGETEDEYGSGTENRNPNHEAPS